MNLEKPFPWENIETAPKDGSEMLLRWEFLYPQDTSSTNGVVIGAWVAGAWTTGEGEHHKSLFTHYMPLDRPEKLAEALRIAIGALTEIDGGTLRPAHYVAGVALKQIESLQVTT